jgi:hypothetical protein
MSDNEEENFVVSIRVVRNNEQQQTTDAKKPQQKKVVKILRFRFVGSSKTNPHKTTHSIVACRIDTRVTLCDGQ